MGSDMIASLIIFSTYMMLVSVFVGAVLSFLAQFRMIHVMQLESYQNPGFLHWLKANARKAFLLPLLSGLLTVVGYYFWSLGMASGQVGMLTVFFVCFGLAMALMIIHLVRSRQKEVKKPLVFTARVKRLLVCEIILFIVFCYVTAFMPLISLYLLPFAYMVFMILVPLMTPLANLVMSPVENGVKKHFFNDAKRKLAVCSDLIKIGVTGSYGKTSVKFILGTILKQKYNTLVPPQSYNTPMGLTRVIREQMTEENQVFIAEMGARHVGDIAELVDLVHPQIGILTSIGPQHLETFHSIENIVYTKYELIKGLPKDTGIAFFNGDNEFCRVLYDNTEIHKKVLYAMDYEGASDVRAENIEFSPEGSTFDVVAGGESFSCTTKLLGKHNILNICGCIAIALELGLSIEQIQKGVAEVPPVQHRLQIVPTDNGITVIDDAFNSNPAGAAAAMEVLAQFSGQKFVVTPGMVELGSKEAEENYKFGEKIAGAATYAFLIGPKHTKPIYDALIASGFPADNIYVAGTLAEATNVMGHLTRPGDVILFENDLPDHYNEN
ncbi:MAG: UDP-N-acetylmuramoyl-tripeptide--D-alanyl-D-alanine ligase [Christensenella sp.]|nr:UDP-N-acetylmuramoyl-tripeptide--D-alanyl-D-alanine ligase [Christensenella sp.]